MIKEILTVYWSQFVLIILALAYFGKRFFDNKSKKIEIKYSLFQQHRIIAVNSFFSNYAKVEFMWHKLPLWDILEYRITAKQIDEIIWPPLYALKQSLFELKVYFNEHEHKIFGKLYENFLELNKIMLAAHGDYSEPKNVIQKANTFSAKRDQTFKENDKIINDLTIVIRNSYTN